MPEAVLEFCSNQPEDVFRGSNILADALKCGICSDLMLNPYTVNCGHSFCGGCLSHWFKLRSNRLTCPACRGTIAGTPAPAIALREFAQQALAAYERVSGKTVKLAKEDLAHPKSEELFGDMHFKGPIYDPEDDIYRCPECNFEIEDGWCSRCEIEYPELDADYHSGDDDEEEEDVDIDDDEMDSDDRDFIDDDDEPERADPVFAERPTMEQVEAVYGPQPPYVHELHRRNGRWRACLVRNDRRPEIDFPSEDPEYLGPEHEHSDDEDDDVDLSDLESSPKPDGDDDDDNNDDDDEDLQVTLVRHRGGVVDDSSDSE